jgi:hypothetical protein
MWVVSRHVETFWMTPRVSQNCSLLMGCGWYRKSKYKVVPVRAVKVYGAVELYLCCV